MNKTILITGGAGYIGLTLSEFLLSMGHTVVAIDSLENSNIPNIPHIHFHFYQGKCEDEYLLDSIFRKHAIHHVIHLASFKGARESHTEIAKYTRNIEMTSVLLRTMINHGVHNLTFSSSAAVYGAEHNTPIIEDTHLRPVNYYGHTKAISESLIHSFHKLYGLNFTILRYFNVVGRGRREDIFPANILPLLKKCIIEKKVFYINGNSHATKDGTCVRDYISLRDIIRAHYACVYNPLNTTINLSSGVGTSIREIIHKTMQICSKEILYEYVEDKYMEPSYIVGNNEKAKLLMNWSPSQNIEEIISEYFIF